MNDENKLAPFNPTCVQAQEIALELLNLTNDDVLFDLGCGDGRLLRRACQHLPGLSCVGIEVDALYVERARVLPNDDQDAASVANMDIREGDVLDPTVQNSHGRLSLSDDATAIFLFLLPKGLVKVRPTLEEIVKSRMAEKRRFRIASYMFRIRDWEPTHINRETKGGCPIYLYDFSPGIESAFLP